MEWFAVDKSGLAKLLSRKGKEFILYELLQNSWDENTKEVRVTLERIAGTKYAKLIVEDDNPEGFVDLSHAFTLFAESTKKSDAGKRGRFNLGEKLVLAVCEEAEISSTKGTVVFDATGRHTRRLKRERGSIFTGTLRLTNEEILHCNQAILRLIPPATISTWYNNEPLKSPAPMTTIESALPTEIADDEGYLRKTVRKTKVEIYRSDSPGMIYEMGIPVVETGDRFHVNILQKVPLNMDRDNVTPSYLSLIRSLVVGATYETLTPEDANATWVKDAIEEHGEKLTEETINRVIDLRFGEKCVSYDPSDQEANKLAVSKGYSVVYGSQMSKAEWETVRRVGAILPAGQVTPSPKPCSEDGAPLKILPLDKWTPDMARTVAYVIRIATRLVGKPVSVRLTNDPTWRFNAAYGHQDMIFSTSKLGDDWFNLKNNRVEINRLTIHELGHEYSGDHLSSEYHDALCRLGAKLAELALEEPEMFLETVQSAKTKTVFAYVDSVLDS